MQFSKAIVCIPSPSFADGLTSARALGPPELRKALSQHAAYCRALGDCGVEVLQLPSDERYPDGTFVEDTAVIAARAAIVTRPGAPSRAGEVAAVAALLRGFRPQLAAIEPPGSVDGGDVCEADGHFLIGVSQRTNEAGARQLADILARHGYSATLIDIRGDPTLLHLKSGIAYLGDRSFVVAPGFPRPGVLAEYEVIETAPEEAYAANCVRVNDYVLVAAGHPRLSAALEGRGFRVRSLDVSEFRKMDGGLSCLSLRF